MPVRALHPIRWTSLFLAAAVTGSIALAAAAEPSPPPDSAPNESPILEERVVTASVTPQDRDTLTSSVSVISGEEIEFLKYDNVAEALRLTPGIHVEQPGSRGGRTSIYVRGLDPNQTVILVDGIRMGDPNNNLGGSFDLSTLDTDSVERVEFVRGPLSAVHGSDALAGAVNVITKRGRDGDSLSLDASGGRYGYGRGVAVVRGQRGIFDAMVSGSYVDDGKPEAASTYAAGNLHATLGVELPEGAELLASLRYVNAEARAFPEASGGEKFAVIRERDKRRYQELSFGLALDQEWNDDLSYQAGVNYYRRREKRDSPAVAPPPSNPFAAVPAQEAHDLLYRTRMNANATYRVLDFLSFTGGADLSFENGNSVSDIDFGAGPVPGSYNQDRVYGGPFLEMNLDTDFGLSAQVGERVDFTSDNDTEWTPRVGARYVVPRIPVTLRGSWGRGFKLPAFFSTADPIIGNEDLDPEKSKGWDVGFDLRLWDGRFLLTATWFEIRVEDLIDFDFATFQLVNRNEVTSKGLEIGLLAFLPYDLTFNGSVTRVRTNIVDSETRLRRRPGWRTSADLQWTPHERLELGITAVWVGSVYDESNPTGLVKLDDYVRFDFRSEVRVWREVSLYLAIDNLFDAHYQEAVGTPSMGIRPRAGVRAVF